MAIDLKAIFSSERGRAIFESVFKCIDLYGMRERLARGVLVGLSGGADSVMLLLVLSEIKASYFDFPLLAVHINHGIRGEEAERDERFSESFAKELGVEFSSFSFDVPKLSAERALGIEECARNVRYEKFREIISGREDLSTIAVAHNADDNLETLILNLLRGAGTRGLAGIPPVREDIVRPLLFVAKADIVALLSECNIPFVTDSTNLLNEYKRNYIRNVITPTLRELYPHPEAMAARSSVNLRCDDECLSAYAKEFLDTHPRLYTSDLLALHKAVRIRVLSLLLKDKDASLSALNLEQIDELLKKENFSYSLPTGARLVSEYGVLRIADKDSESDYGYFYSLKQGLNEFPEYSSAILITDKDVTDYSANVYRISIIMDLSSAIIEGDLALRPRRDGDTVRYGGMTHKIKKLFSDRKVPPSQRESIPLLCDSRGVVCVPGYGVRDDGGGAKLKMVLLTKIGEKTEKRFRHGKEFINSKKLS